MTSRTVIYSISSDPLNERATVKVLNVLTFEMNIFKEVTFNSFQGSKMRQKCAVFFNLS